MIISPISKKIFSSFNQMVILRKASMIGVETEISSVSSEFKQVDPFVIKIGTSLFVVKEVNSLTKIPKKLPLFSCDLQRSINRVHFDQLESYIDSHAFISTIFKKEDPKYHEYKEKLKAFLKKDVKSFFGAKMFTLAIFGILTEEYRKILIDVVFLRDYFKKFRLFVDTSCPNETQRQEEIDFMLIILFQEFSLNKKNIEKVLDFIVNKGEVQFSENFRFHFLKMIWMVYAKEKDPDKIQAFFSSVFDFTEMEVTKENQDYFSSNDIRTLMFAKKFVHLILYSFPSGGITYDKNIKEKLLELTIRTNDSEDPYEKKFQDILLIKTTAIGKKDYLWQKKQDCIVYYLVKLIYQLNSSLSQEMEKLGNLHEEDSQEKKKIEDRIKEIRSHIDFEIIQAELKSQRFSPILCHYTIDQFQKSIEKTMQEGGIQKDYFFLDAQIEEKIQTITNQVGIKKEMVKEDLENTIFSQNLQINEENKSSLKAYIESEFMSFLTGMTTKIISMGDIEEIRREDIKQEFEKGMDSINQSLEELQKSIGIDLSMQLHQFDSHAFPNSNISFDPKKNLDAYELFTIDKGEPLPNSGFFNENGPKELIITDPEEKIEKKIKLNTKDDNSSPLLVKTTNLHDTFLGKKNQRYNEFSCFDQEDFFENTNRKRTDSSLFHKSPNDLSPLSDNVKGQNIHLLHSYKGKNQE